MNNLRYIGKHVAIKDLKNVSDNHNIISINTERGYLIHGTNHIRPVCISRDAVATVLSICRSGITQTKDIMNITKLSRATVRNAKIIARELMGEKEIGERREDG
jgi:hypothetical protein